MTHPQEFKVLAADVAAHAVGLCIRDMEKLDIVEIETLSGNIYTLVVMDPEQSLVALRDRKLFKEPVCFVLQGSTCGSRMLYTAHIDLGRQLEFTNAVGMRVSTSVIVSLKPIDDPALAEALISDALANPLFQ